MSMFSIAVHACAANRIDITTHLRFRLILILIALLMVAASSQMAEQLSTSPETSTNVDRPIPIREGDNYTIICNVTNDGTHVPTEWYIQRPSDSSLKHIAIAPETGLVEYPEGLNYTVTITGPVVYKLITYANQFYITNFTRSLHMTKLQCGTLNYNTRRSFVLGIEVTPTIQNSSAAFTEGQSNVSITLDILEMETSIFPSINYTKWRHNGKEIPADSKEITAGKYYINFTHNISRFDAGTYTLLLYIDGAINETVTGFFTLQIYYPVNAIAYQYTEVAQLNTTTTLFAFDSLSIDGWPMPQILWIHPTGQNIITSTERYNIDTPGQITIMDIESNDEGNYSCFLYNRFSAIGQKVDLRLGVGINTDTAAEAGILLSSYLYVMIIVIMSLLVVIVLILLISMSTILLYKYWMQKAVMQQHTHIHHTAPPKHHDSPLAMIKISSNNNYSEYMKLKD